MEALNRSRFRKAWLVGIFVLLTLVGGYYFAVGMDWFILKKLNGWLLAVLLVVAALYTAVNALGTWVLLRGMGHCPHYGRLYLVTTASLSTNYITPVKVGIPVRLWLYRVVLGVPVSSGSASVVIETTLGLLIAGVLSLGGVWSVLGQRDAKTYLAMLSAVVVGAVLLLLFGRQVVHRSVKLLSPKYFDRIVGWGERFIVSLRSVSMWALVGMILLYLLRVSIRALCLALILQDAKVSVSLIDVVSIQSISGMIGIVSMLPMGLGVRDATLAVLLTRVGVPRSMSLVAVLVDRVLWTLVPLVVGGISVNVLGVRQLLGRNEDDRQGEASVGVESM